MCRGKDLAVPRRVWWNLYNQLETLAVRAWDGLVDIEKMKEAGYPSHHYGFIVSVTVQGNIYTRRL